MPIAEQEKVPGIENHIASTADRNLFSVFALM